MPWLRIAVLVIAVVVMHDAWMATTGHAALASQGTAVAAADRAPYAHRHGHDHAVASEAETPATDEAAEHCDPLREIARPNRDMSPSLDSGPVAQLPSTTILMLFAATSRDIVETPPAHPPDLDRSHYGVYRI